MGFQVNNWGRIIWGHFSRSPNLYSKIHMSKSSLAILIIYLNILSAQVSGGFLIDLMVRRSLCTLTIQTYLGNQGIIIWSNTTTHFYDRKYTYLMEKNCPKFNQRAKLLHTLWVTCHDLAWILFKTSRKSDESFQLNKNIIQ